MNPSATLNFFTGTARRRALSTAASLLLVLPIVLVACEITDVDQPSAAQQGQVIDIAVTVNQTDADANAHKGVLSVLVPTDWSYVSGIYTGPGVSGTMDENIGWADSTARVLPAPTGYKWIGILSSGAHTVPNANSIFVADIKFMVGQSTGAKRLGYFTTNTGFAVRDITLPPTDFASADTLMNVPINITPFVANESSPDDQAFRIAQNSPNPVRHSTSIAYTLDKAASIEISVLDLRGREVAVVARGNRAPGMYSAEFDASALPNGTYLYRIVADGAIAQTRRMTVSR